MKEIHKSDMDLEKMQENIRINPYFGNISSNDSYVENRHFLNFRNKPQQIP